MPSTDKHFYEFGPFRLDVQKHRLLCGGELVPLSPKALEALTVFVQHPNEMLEREALMQAVWADTFVEDANFRVGSWIVFLRVKGRSTNSRTDSK